MSDAILIFPSAMPEAVTQACRMKAAGFRVIGASNTAPGLVDDLVFDEQVYLPHITEPGFEGDLKALLESAGIVAVICPHVLAHKRVGDLLAAWDSPVRLLNGRQDREVSLYLTVMRSLVSRFDLDSFAGHTLDEAVDLPDPAWQASLLAQFDRIPGQCPFEKVFGMMLAVASAPRGDVVEIGSLWGRSAFVLAALARHYQVGSFLSVDPWTVDDGLQWDAHELVRAVSQEGHLTDGYAAFTLYMRSLFTEGVGRLRATSSEGFKRYPSVPGTLTDPDFGPVEYEGQIAVLHVDGNHDYEVVRQDLVEWGGRVKPGGWLIVDDYVWGMGSGPDRAGDEWLQAHRSALDVAFVLGDALFIRLRS